MASAPLVSVRDFFPSGEDIEHVIIDAKGARTFAGRRFASHLNQLIWHMAMLEMGEEAADLMHLITTPEWRSNPALGVAALEPRVEAHSQWAAQQEREHGVPRDSYGRTIRPYESQALGLFQTYARAMELVQQSKRLNKAVAAV